MTSGKSPYQIGSFSTRHNRVVSLHPQMPSPWTALFSFSTRWKLSCSSLQVIIKKFIFDRGFQRQTSSERGQSIWYHLTEGLGKEIFSEDAKLTAEIFSYLVWACIMQNHHFQMHLLNRYNPLCIYGYCFNRNHLLHSHLCCTCSFWYHSQEHKERESYALLCSLELNSRGEYHGKWNGWRIRNAMRKTHLDRHSYCKINSQ